MIDIFHTAIVGGGAAGMMAAATLIEQGEGSVVLFEKNARLGQKVLISGGGRCNVTTGITDIKEILKRYPRGAKFISYAMYEFAPLKVIEWFEEHGVPLKTEEDLRVFPVSDNGNDVVGVFEHIFSSLGNGERAIIKLGTGIVDVRLRENEEYKFELTTDKGEHFYAKNVVLTTGGQAYRHTGSTGDGYAFAQKMGHNLTPLGPSLSSFFTQDAWVPACAGVSVERATLTLQGANDSWKFSGPFVFTHRGVSGPTIFALSAYGAFEPISKAQNATLFIDFFPDERRDVLEARVAKMAKEHPKKNLINLVDMFFPLTLARVAVDSCDADPTLHVAQVSRDTWNRLIDFMKSAKISLNGRGSGEEFVTAGGISTAEIDQKTLQSKLCPGLYFAGEIIDVDGFTGGFNLQASWAGGHLVGKSIIQ